MNTNNLVINPFILSGGSGTRLWPLSRSTYPKQFLNLFGETSLFQQSVTNLDHDFFAAPHTLCNNDHRFLVAEQLLEVGAKNAKIVLEPVGRNTAPAALIAALMIPEERANELILLMPSDHVIADKRGFQDSVIIGAKAAQEGQLVTFGVHPTGPETGYGYIETSKGNDEILNVMRFVEKPTLEKAKAYCDAGTFIWNAGIFLYRADTLISAFEKHAPQMLIHCRNALENSEHDLDFIRLSEKHYSECENISFDYAILEKADNIKCVPLQTKWNDLGAWPAVRQELEQDSKGNASSGDVLFHEVSNSFAHSTDGACLSIVGLDNIMAIATKDAVLVTSGDKAQEVGKIVKALESQSRDEAISHRRVYRPWGWFERLELGERFQVKCLMVKSGSKLSLQSHHHRAEHWVVVSGTVEVTLDEKTFLLAENESTYIPIGAVHRITNPSKLPALLIEVQTGSYLGEDDIVRYDDIYGRIEKK